MPYARKMLENRGIIPIHVLAPFLRGGIGLNQDLTLPNQLLYRE